MGNPFSKPKMPKPVEVVAPASVPDEAALAEERIRRAKTTGSSGNIVSTLAGAPSDIEAFTKKSKLLGG